MSQQFFPTFNKLGYLYTTQHRANRFFLLLIQIMVSLPLRREFTRTTLDNG